MANLQFIQHLLGTLATDKKRRFDREDWRNNIVPPVFDPTTQGQVAAAPVAPTIAPPVASSFMPPIDDADEQARMRMLSQLPIQSSPPIPAATAENQIQPPAFDMSANGALSTGIQPPIFDPLEARLRILDEKDYSIKKDEAGNIIHRGKDRDQEWSTWDKIASAIAGWAQGGLVGGIKAGTDRNYFEKMGDVNQRADLLPKIAARQQIERTNADTMYKQQRPAIERDKLRHRIELEKTKFNNKTKTLEIQARNEGGKWKPYVDENGRRWKQYQNDPSKELEPIIDPLTQEQDIDPNFKLYDYTDPASGTTVKVTGRILSDRGVRQAEFNARQTQGAATTNVNNEIKVAQANNAALAKWNADNLDVRLKAITQAGAGLANVGELQGVSSQMQLVGQQLIDAGDALNAATLPDDIASAQKRFDKAQSDLAELQGKFDATLGKTQAGQNILGELQKISVPKPKTLSAPKVKPSVVGKPVPKSKDPLGIFQ